MKSILFITFFSAFFCTTHLNCQSNNDNHKTINDSIKFNKFLNKFKDLNLPLSFNVTNIGTIKPYIGVICDSLVNEYISDICNYDLMNVYLYIGKFEISNGYAVIYKKKTETEGVKTILATFTNTGKNISKIILWGIWGDYYLESKINSIMEIDTKTIYSYEDQVFENAPITLPQEKYPGYFYIFSYTSKYKILNNGKIVLLSEAEKELHIAQKGDFDSVLYKYPVELPK